MENLLIRILSILEIVATFGTKLCMLYKSYPGGKIKVDDLIKMKRLSGSFSEETKRLFDEKVNHVCVYSLTGIRAEGKRKEDVMAFYRFVREEYGLSELRRAMYNLKANHRAWALNTSSIEMGFYGFNVAMWHVLFWAGFMLLVKPTLLFSSDGWDVYGCIFFTWGVGLWGSYFLWVKPFANFNLAKKMLCVFFSEKLKTGFGDNEKQKELEKDAEAHKIRCKKLNILFWISFIVSILCGGLLLFFLFFK